MGLFDSCDACEFEKYKETEDGLVSYCLLDELVITGSGNHDRMTEKHPCCPLKMK